MLDIDNSQSYASEDNLVKALKKYGFDQYKPLIVCNREGRFTAVFAASLTNGNMFAIANRGFKVIG